MRLDTKPGEIVVFTGKGGYEIENTSARKRLSIGDEYEVEEVRVSSFVSFVSLKGQNFSYNTVLFENKEPDNG